VRPAAWTITVSPQNRVAAPATITGNTYGAFEFGIKGIDQAIKVLPFNTRHIGQAN